MMIRCDVLIIGAGPGGLAAAKGAREAGAERVIILERDTQPGGILNQCIHDGFGLIRYKKTLTGPEYAHRAAQEAAESGAELLTGHQVVRMERVDSEAAERGVDHGESSLTQGVVHPKDSFIEVTAVNREGLKTFRAGAVVMALGCRERTRGAISIPGSRPAGVFTAGVIQNFVNLKNIMPGHRVVILGSGDVGMIMARRLTLEGAKVEVVVEILPEPAGLARNVSQCLYDYGIPIMCSHTVSRIIGKKKLEAVEISQIDQNMKPISGTQQIIECDALVLSVGLIPENEIAETAGVTLDPKTNGALTDACMQTDVQGIFSCGNSRRIMDLADFVSEQGELAGRNAVAYLNGGEMQPWDETRTTSMRKGYPIPDTVTCPLCPNGCQVRRAAVTGTAGISFGDTESNSDAGRLSDLYEGHKCPRGAVFAEQERTAPKRMLTTTVRAGNGQLIPVRTEKPIAKEKIFDAMAQLRSFTVARTDGFGPVAQIRCGDVLTTVTDADGTPVPVIATATKENGD